MADVFYDIGAILLILALLALIGVLVWIAMTVLHAKKSVMDNAGRLYKRPLNAGKNLIATGKGIAQQETVRVKHVLGTVKDTATSVKGSAMIVKDAVQAVRPEELQPVAETVGNVTGAVGNVSKLISLASGLSKAAAKQRPSG